MFRRIQSYGLGQMKRLQLYRMLTVTFGVLVMAVVGLSAASIVWGQANRQGSDIKPVLSDGQFVYGPNVEGFDLDAYLEQSAPHLLPYRDSLFFYSLYPSINPKVLLTLIEVQSGLVLTPPQHPSAYETALGLSTSGPDLQLEMLTKRLTSAYYWHLHNVTLTNISVEITSSEGVGWQLPPELNAATYALLDAFAPNMTSNELATFIDKEAPRGFYQTYRHLFPDDPLDDSNQIDVYTLPPPDLLQFPFPVGESWRFNGVHNWSGYQGSDMSSIDFIDGSPKWGDNTDNMWVVAAAAGTVTKRASCWASIDHGDGWETYYYHLENIQQSSGSVNRNQRLANVANTEAEALCPGGDSTGPHVHFSLRRNGAYFALNGVHLSGREVHSGQSPYDNNCTDMYLLSLLILGDQKTCVGTTIPNSGVGPPFVDIPLDHWAVEWITVFHKADYGNGLPHCEPSDADNPYRFCPDKPITRAEMAVLLLQAKYVPNYSPPPATGKIFNDVPISHWAAAWIEKLKEDGYTAGCSTDPPLYCPDDPLTRAEMAVFLVRLKHGTSYTPPQVSFKHFSDVPWSHWGVLWIEHLWSHGGTAGCWLSPPRYCPDRSVTRAEIVTFFAKYLGLVPLGGGGGPESNVFPVYLPVIERNP